MLEVRVTLLCVLELRYRDRVSFDEVVLDSSEVSLRLWGE